MTTRAFPLICLCALLALAGVARAEAPKLVPNSSFASEGGLGVAVNQSSGDVFTTGFFNFANKEVHPGRGEKFEASGNVLSPPSPFAEGLNYGAAVNPTNGDLYVASPFGQIETYDPDTGALLSSFPVPPFWTEAVELYENFAQIATDSAGNVYVPNVPGNEVLEYSPTPAVVGGVAVPLATFAGSGAHTLSKPTGVAVDSSGDVWVADDGHNRIEEFSPSGAFLSEFESEGVRGLALYEHEGAVDVLAIVYNSADSCGSITPPCDHLVEYSSSGAQLADLGAGDFGGYLNNVLWSLSMVAVDEASGRVYVTDGAKDLVWVFQAPVAPVLGQESAVEVGTTEANLGALVNPGGAQATYRFEYDTREYTEGEGPHGVSVPFPEGSVGEGFSSHSVWASAGGLEPGTTYYYRAVATNGVGTVVGPDETFTTQTAAQAACPNEQFRGGFSAALPDCRAYELVTPSTTSSFQVDTGSITGGFLNGGGVTNNFAARDGNRMSFQSTEAVPGSLSDGFEDVATRGASGWSIEDVIPRQAYTGDRCPYYGLSSVRKYSANLSQVIVTDNGDDSDDCRGEVVEVVPGEPLGDENLLLRDNTDGTYQLIDVTPPGLLPTNAGFVGASAELGLVIFNDGAKLTPEAPVNGGAYEWSKGVVHFLKFALPSGAPVAGSLVSISPDGSDVFFSADGNLYVRVNDERTVQVDQARGGSGPGGGGSFGAVTADGSQVFFTDEASAGLTSDTVPGSASNLYSYDIDTGQLSDLTPVSDAKAALDNIGDEGSYVYFTSESVLSGSQANQFDETAESGKRNLYLDHGGTITFVMQGEGGVMSSNGAFIVFGSHIYSAASNRFECWSCNPSGEAPTAGGPFIGEAPHSVSDNGQVFFQTAEALLPRATDGQTNVYEYDYLGGLHLISSGTSPSESTLLDVSESGNDVFFLGRQALVPRDNGEEANKIYDARVDGGFPETAVPSCATADACRAAPSPQPAIFGEPASQTFSGAGNITPAEAKPKAKPKSKPVKCKKGFLKKKGKCVKKPSKKTGQSAHANKRTGK